MGEFSLPHILIVLVIVLVFFGPSRLPGLGKSLGEAIRGFKQGIGGDGDANHNANNTPANPAAQAPLPTALNAAPQAPVITPVINSSEVDKNRRS